MAQADTAGVLWSITTIAGPILLAAALLYSLLRNRRSRSEKLKSEQAVRDQHNIEREKEGLPPETTPVSSTKG